ncbi:hypothetical protein CCP3SC1AL1_4470003 [Gammaproteobacteria bacterium]
MSHYHYFENLFVPYGDETLILTGHAQYNFEQNPRGEKYARFISSNITDLHRVTELDTELQGYTEADKKHFQKLAVDLLNTDTELTYWLPSTI